MAAEEDKLHQQGGDFKLQHPYRHQQDRYQDSPEGDEASRSFLDHTDVLSDGEASAGPTSPSLIEIKADTQIPSLGSGVIEDFLSFSPFTSLFTASASITERSTAVNFAPPPSAAPSTLSSSTPLSFLPSCLCPKKYHPELFVAKLSLLRLGVLYSKGDQNNWRRNFNNRTTSSGSLTDEICREATISRNSRRGDADRLRRSRQISAASKSYSPQGLNDNEDVEANALQITSMHAVGFILLSSSFLLIMYFIDIYFVVSMLYLFAAGFASSKVFFYPFFTRLVRTYTAIRLDVEIDAVSDHGSARNCCGIDLPMLLSGTDYSSLRYRSDYFLYFYLRTALPS